jgi:hypothetical protein
LLGGNKEKRAQAGKLIAQTCSSFVLLLFVFLVYPFFFMEEVRKTSALLVGCAALTDDEPTS